ncbi:hypothetical protein EYC84_011790 [Monilinia fructicola]|uniref:Uncharacterized protein n=1 Tax=Monilinia fructicola TaxID=38448 RepID=A0A5M9J6F5_MONFR|nr:hypothetical protein EYC84_011790 [Monilinia fructicola]
MSHLPKKFHQSLRAWFGGQTSQPGEEEEIALEPGSATPHPSSSSPFSPLPWPLPQEGRGYQMQSLPRARVRACALARALARPPAPSPSPSPSRIREALRAFLDAFWRFNIFFFFGPTASLGTFWTFIFTFFMFLAAGIVVTKEIVFLDSRKIKIYIFVTVDTTDTEGVGDGADTFGVSARTTLLALPTTSARADGIALAISRQR